MENNYMGARLAADPSLYQGYKNAEYYHFGGSNGTGGTPVPDAEKICGGP